MWSSSWLGDSFVWSRRICNVMWVMIENLEGLDDIVVGGLVIGVGFLA
jgi:hypothetical protein